MPASEAKAEAPRRIAIAVDLSDESAHAVRWAIANYLRKQDQVIILHVRPTSVLYGADWGASSVAMSSADMDTAQKLEDDFDRSTLTRTEELAAPLQEAGISFKVVVVKDHDMKERLCLEVERLRVSACIMGSRGVGAEKRSRKARLGSVSDYCVHHCDCPVIVVRMPDEKVAEDAPTADNDPFASGTPSSAFSSITDVSSDMRTV